MPDMTMQEIAEANMSQNLQADAGELNRRIQQAYALGLEVDVRVSLVPEKDPPYNQVPQVFVRLLREI